MLTVAETDFVWEEQVVYHQPNKTESLAWGLFKDGMRSLTIRRGAEQEELPRFLEAINRARFLPADAGDDLLTLLWEQEFQLIQYQFIEFFGEGGGSMPEQTGNYPSRQRGRRPPRSSGTPQAAEEAPPRPKGVVDLEEFDSTLYFLDEAEIHQVARQVEEEYARDVRASALNVLFDLFELEGEPAIRAEILGILEQLFPNLLNARDFRTAASVLRESKLAGHSGRRGCRRSTRARLDGFVAKLSEPAIVSQLLQSLDEAPALAGRGRGGRGAARAARHGAGAGAQLDSQPRRRRRSRTVLEGVADRLAAANTDEVLRILRSPDSEALASVVALCGRLQLHQTVPGLAETITHTDPAVRLASVQALAQLGTPAALALIDKAIEDDDRGVRLAAVRVVGGRGYKGALKRVEAVVLGKGRQGHGPHREDGVLRGLRRHRRRRGPQGAERHCCCRGACSS